MRLGAPLPGVEIVCEEQAWPLIMLNSPRSSYVTATTLMTDGGFAGGIYTGGIDPALLMPAPD